MTATARDAVVPLDRRMPVPIGPMGPMGPIEEPFPLYL